MKPPKVFISYAHESEQLADKVLEFSNFLRSKGIDANIDQYEESPEEGWPKWMENQIEESDFVLVICTELYYQHVRNSESNKGYGVVWESSIIYQELYDLRNKNNKYIPIIFKDYKPQNILKPLKSATIYYIDREKERNKLTNRLKGVKNVIKPPIGNSEEINKVTNERVEPKERKSLYVTSVIDIPTWDKAFWRGVGYAFDPEGEKPPSLVLIFENIEKGKKIFSKWLDNENISNNLSITIVEQPIKGNSYGYYCIISSNFDSLINRLEELNEEETLIAYFSRIQYMNSNLFNDNLSIFKKQYHHFGECTILPLSIEEGKDFALKEKKRLDFSLSIKSKAIRFLKEQELTKKDPEYDLLLNELYKRSNLKE